MSRFTWMSTVISFLALVLPAPSAYSQITDAQVRESIQRGMRYLISQQKTTGGWQESFPVHPGGVTSLCTLALLNCGQDVKSREIQLALQHLRSLGNPEMVYAVSLQTMVFCLAEPNRDKAMILNNVQWLEKAQLKEGNRKGAWAYSPGRGSGDNSNTQFALLALYEAERIGVAVDPETWKLALDYWLRTQRKDGSWGYTEGDPSTGSMTCAGIASVIIAMGQINQGDATVEGGQVQCCGQQADNGAIDHAFNWLGDKFQVVRNPGSSSYLYYYLYGVERVGRMSGRRFIGGHDWFRESAELIVSQQDALQGRWEGVQHSETEPLVATPLALLVLSKGRRPVVMSKLRHGQGTDWDSHRSGVQHLTNRVERLWKRDLTWQTIDMQAATAEDLLESPVLFLSGNNHLEMTAEDEEKLRQYVSRGGFIFAEACCGGEAFDHDFRELMKRLFPDSTLRLLPADHPVWFAEQKVDPEFMKPLYGIDACCRTSVVYCPQDLSCYWELNRGARQTTYPDAVKKQIEASLRIGSNVVTYATNRELRNKLDRPQFAIDSAKGEVLDRGTLRVPKLLHGGGSDDAPQALPNMLQFLRTQGQMRVVVENRLIAATDEELAEFPIAFMHGRRAFRFSAEERQALATFVERGGTLFADAICASPQFAESFHREMEAVFPGKKFARIPPEHPLFTNAFRGFDIPKVTLRDPQQRAGEDPLRATLNQVSPVLEGLMIDDRIAVIFSPFDLSCALESGASLDCKGYTKEDAGRLAINVMLFALQQ
jgi:hypothetical protein